MLYFMNILNQFVLAAKIKKEIFIYNITRFITCVVDVMDIANSAYTSVDRLIKRSNNAWTRRKRDASSRIKRSKLLIWNLLPALILFYIKQINSIKLLENRAINTNTRMFVTHIPICLFWLYLQWIFYPIKLGFFYLSQIFWINFIIII